MLAEVRKCAEAHDVKGLRYIFVDSLDVDPTFEKYKEDYEYCKSIPGLFDEHQILNGITADKSKWTAQYWEQLKIDLMKNFSETRFEHMMEVAQIVYADKIVRLLSERDALDRGASVLPQDTIDSARQPIPAADVLRPISDAELQEKRIAEKKRQLEAENRRIEETQAIQRAKIEAAKRESLRKQNVQGRSFGSKKVLGIVLAIIVVVVVVLMVKALP